MGTNVPSVNRKIQLEETQYLDGQGQNLAKNISQAINFLIDSSLTTMLGRIQTSVLDEETFQLRRGDVWVLMQGQSIIGSDYEVLTGITTLPDMRGRFIRTIDDSRGLDPDAPRALYSEQEDDNLTHNHRVSSGPAASPPETDITGSQRIANQGQQSVWVRGLDTTNNGLLGYTGSEFRGKNLAFNYFIRINI